MSPNTFIVVVPAFQDSFVALPAPLTTTSKGESTSSTSPTAVLRSELNERLARLRELLRLSEMPWSEKSAPAGRSDSKGRTFAARGAAVTG
jgi:hypothetical protein